MQPNRKLLYSFRALRVSLAAMSGKEIFPFVTCIVFLLALVISAFITSAYAEVAPRPSQFDSRMQQVIYNPQNVSAVNAKAGFYTTLIFGDDEAVQLAKPGFEAAWEAIKDANRVYVQPRPIKQGAPGADGNTEQVVIPPNSKDWRSNLFVVTNKHVYSIALNALDDDSKEQPAWVVYFRYPQDEASKASDVQKLQQAAMMRQAEKNQIERSFATSKTPRNFDYSMHVGNYSRQITPDYAWDDGRFTYIGFSPQKRLPSVFELNEDGKERKLTPGIEYSGGYTVVVVKELLPNLILRSGNAVIGIDNNGYGKVRVPDGDTVSPRVQLVEKKNVQ
ncbi:P-type conjugative transfer protein VirB9 [Pantoea ananatis]|uniref:P-type conjugative transfer protein VirB9 n=1 Tax=Pantoea ananas TaxID=553 RepID=UPI001FF0C7D4|nr:P-type conjugative transfer protein VirB9 [Pantoea ananatis]